MRARYFLGKRYLPCEQFMLASTTLPFLMGTLVDNFGELDEIEFIAVRACVCDSARDSVTA